MLLPFILLLLCFFCFLPSSSSSSSLISLCHPDEAAALLHFKHSFSITTYAYNCSYLNYYSSIGIYDPVLTHEKGSYPKTKSWKESSDCCKWEGVRCDNVTGRVIGLDLSCSQLEGSFPPNSTLFNGLLHLQTLNLASNYVLDSKIPVELGRLTALKHLDLSNSSFYGHVPSTLSHLSNLEYLDLSLNSNVEMESSVFGEFVQNLSMIRHLFLDELDMSTIKVNLLANFSSTLTSFSARACRMRGRLPEGIFNRPKLKLLMLSGNLELTGYLPDSIGQSTSLKYLELVLCSLSGSIPNSLGNLSNLALLNLGLNYFSGGQFLHFLTNLTQLRRLELPLCLLSGSIPDHHVAFPRLEYLDLSNNNLTGNTPLWLQNQTQLTHLDLGRNLLTGSIPNFIGTKLQHLSLEENKFRGMVPSSIYEQRNLSKLHLSSNNLSGLVDLDRLSKLRHLLVLDLGHNMLTFTTSTGITFPSLQFLRIPSLGINEFPGILSNNLFELDISNNRIHHIPEWMFDLSRDSLSYLNLSYNSIEVLDQIPWKNLTFLDIRSNLIHGKIPSSICLLASLYIVDLSHNMFEASIPQCLSNSSSSLSVLNLGRNRLRGKIPATFGGDCILECLDLSGNQLEGPIPESISHCRGLQVLNLGTNKLNGSIPGWVETLPELQVLILRSNNLHGSLGTFSNHKHIFHQLHILDLSNNHFDGNIPGRYMRKFKSMVYLDYNLTRWPMYMKDTKQSYEFSVSLTMKGSEVVFEKILTVFTSIDLSGNNFYGEIPEEIGMLGALKGLNLSHNKLSGHIPQSLGNLKNLEWLDISSNKLTGQIPEQLAEYLTFLGTLNLSYNQLTGPIPTGPQFNGFSNDSYVGNEGLCGLPLSKSCRTSYGKMPPILEQPTEDSVDESVIEWKAVLMGFPCGLSFGISIGCFMFRNGDPKWFQKLITIAGEGSPNFNCTTNPAESSQTCDSRQHKPQAKRTAQPSLVPCTKPKTTMKWSASGSMDSTTRGATALCV